MAKDTVYLDVTARVTKAETGLKRVQQQLDKTKAKTLAVKPKSAFFSGLQASWMGIAAGIAVVVGAMRGLTKLINKSIESFGIQEKSVANLNHALRATGIYSAETSAELQRFNSELQVLTGVADEVSNKAMAMLQRSAHLTTEQLKEAYTATIDFASANDLDLVKAAQIVGQTLGTSTNKMMRYGVAVDGAVGSSGRFESAMSSLGVFTGHAADQLDTYVGQVAAMEGNIGDTKEMLGDLASAGLKPIVAEFNKIILATRLSDETMGILRDGFYKLGVAISELINAYNVYYTEIARSLGITGEIAPLLTVITTVIRVVASNLRVFSSVITTLINVGLLPMKIIIGGLITGWTDFFRTLKSGENIFKAIAAFFKGEWQAATNAIQSTSNNIAESWQGSYEAVQNLYNPIELAEEAANDLASAVRDVGDASDETTQTIEENNARLWADYEARMDAEAKATEDAEAKKQAAIDETTKTITDGASIALDAAKLLVDIGTGISDKRIAEIEKELAEQLKALDDEAEARLSAAGIGETARTASLEKDLRYYERINDKKKVSDIKKELEVMKINEDIAARKAEIEEKLSEKIRTEKTRQAKAAKAAAIFEATINLAKAIVAVIANPVLVAVVAALGAAQIATIAAQPIPEFARGGVVGGAGTKDDVLALLSPGEGVITRAAMSRLGSQGLSNINNDTTNVGGITINVSAASSQEFAESVFEIMQDKNALYGGGVLA